MTKRERERERGDFDRNEGDKARDQDITLCADEMDMSSMRCQRPIFFLRVVFVGVVCSLHEK